MTDYSIASKIVAPSFDPLKTIGQAQAVQAGMLNNRLLGQNVAQTLAQRAAAQASIGPDGLDTKAYIAHLASGGASPEALLNAQQQQTAEYQAKDAGLKVSADQRAQALDENTAGGEFLEPYLIMAKKDPTLLSPDKVDAAAQTALLDSGRINSAEGKAHIAQILGSLSPTDFAHNATVLTQAKNYALGTVRGLGAINQVTTGAGTSAVRTDPVSLENTTGPNPVPNEAPATTPVMVRNADGTMTPSAVTGAQFAGLAKQGPVATAAPVSKSGLTPGQLAQTVTVIDPTTKEPRTTTLGELLGQPVGALGGAQPTVTGPKNGRYLGAAAGGNQLEAPGGIQTGFAPGSAEAMTSSASTYLADQAAVPNLKRTLTTFDQGYAAMKNATTGPASERLQNLRGIADTYGIPLPKGISNPDATVAYAEANKWMTSALTSEAQRLGLGTDAARALQGEAQPGVHTVKDAAMAMIPVLKGLKAMDLVAPVIAKQQGWTPQQYVEKRAQWANSVDPMAFGADLMPKAQRQAIIANLKTPEARAKYAQGLRDAESAGLFTIKDLAN